jgi:hypothetical protein
MKQKLSRVQLTKDLEEWRLDLFNGKQYVHSHGGAGKP